MAPLAPEFISDQMNLVVAFFLGIAFGFVLEQAGFSSSRRLAGVFYGYDFTVLRVFFTAAVTAMLGVIVLGYWGVLDLHAIYVNPLWLRPAIVGGVIMGLGFILGGYCPGTSVCAAAIGKIDAFFFVGGGLLGVFAYGELFPLYQSFNDSTALGSLLVFDSIGVPKGAFVFGMVLAAVGAFVATTWIERKVAPAAAPSLAFSVRNHVLAGAAALALGFLALFMPDYRARLLARVARSDHVATHPVRGMSPDELAFRLLDEDPRLQIVDIRAAEDFAARPLPRSLHAPVAELFGRDLAPTPPSAALSRGQNVAELFGRDLAPTLSPRGVKKVVVGTDEEEQRQACLLLQELGYENIVVLEGAFPAFDRLILSGAAYVPAGNRWDGDLRQFREDARAGLLKQIDEAKSSKKKSPAPEKKIQGGC